MDARARLAELLERAEEILAEYNPVKMLSRDKREPDQPRKEKLSRMIARVVRRRLSKQLERLYFQLRMQFPQRGTKAIGDVIDFDALFEEDPEEAQELIAMILQGAQGGMELVKLQTRLQLDYGLTNAEAAAWARRYSYELIKDLDKTTLEVIKSAVTDFIKDPDYTMSDLFDLLEPQFGRVRAERIAVTEVTRAYSQGQRMARETLKEQFPGVTIITTWFTNNDDLVCPLCGPLDGEEREGDAPFYQPEDAYQDGHAPRHVGCRCWESSTTRIGKSLKYSDDQPRDEAGRWTSGGYGSGSTGGERYTSVLARSKSALDRYAQLMPEHASVVDKLKNEIGIGQNITDADYDFLNNDPDYVTREAETIRRKLISSVPLNVLDEAGIPLSKEERTDIARKAFITYQLNDNYGHDMRANADYLRGKSESLHKNIEAFGGDDRLNMSMQKQSADLIHSISTTTARNIDVWRGSSPYGGKVGDVIDVSLMSFSHEESVARGNFGRDRTLIHLTGQSMGISVANDLGEGYSGGRFEFEREYLTGGSFSVDTIEESNGWTIVNVMQTAPPIIKR